MHSSRGFRFKKNAPPQPRSIHIPTKYPAELNDQYPESPLDTQDILGSLLESLDPINRAPITYEYNSASQYVPGPREVSYQNSDYFEPYIPEPLPQRQQYEIDSVLLQPPTNQQQLPFVTQNGGDFLGLACEENVSVCAQAVLYTTTTTTTTAATTTAASCQPTTTTTSEPVQHAMEAELIAAAATATTNRTFVKPSPRPAPVKGMSGQSGKRMSQDRRTYMTPASECEDDDDDGRRTQSHGESDREEEVDSPVAGGTPSEGRRSRSHEKKSKRKRRQRSSSSTSDSSSSYDRSPTGRRRRRHKERKEEESSSSSRRSKKKARSDRDSSRSRSRSRSHTHGPQITEAAAAARKAATTPVAEKRSRPLESRPEVANNMVYEAIMKTKSAREITVSEADAASRVTSVQSKTPRRNQQPLSQSIDSQSLEKIVPEQLQGSDLCKQTILKLRDYFKRRKNVLVEELRYVTHVAVDEDTRPQCMRIDEKQFLLSTKTQNFGYSFATLEENRSLTASSLTIALMTKNNDKNSLDTVFHRALKELTEELHTFEESHEITITNPVFVSGRYLELRLLQKIKEHYKKTMNEDVVEYITDCVQNEQSPLKKLVDNCACKMYVGRLCDRYSLRKSNFDGLVAEKPITPSLMRVWTDVKTQCEINVQVLNFVTKVYDDVRLEWNRLSEREKETRPLHKVFIDEYRDRMKPFVRAYGPFLSEIVKASELFAWMCLGITIDDAAQGTGHMAKSYHLGKMSTNSPFVAWNYPLASMLPNRQSSSFTEPLEMNILDDWDLAMEDHASDQAIPPTSNAQ